LESKKKGDVDTSRGLDDSSESKGKKGLSTRVRGGGGEQKG